MLQIIGVTCKQLETLDIWKSTSVTDSGIRMFLGLDAERPFKVCSSLRKAIVKDTSISDIGAYNLLIHCEKLESLEFSQDSFIQQLLWRISENYGRTKTTFNLRTLFLQVNKPCTLLKVIKSFPMLEDLSLWSSLENASDLSSDDLKDVHTLKLGGLNHQSFLTDVSQCIGPQLTSLKIETVHFDVDIGLIGKHCSNLEDLNVINAKVKITTSDQNDDHSSDMFSKLKLLYFFLVQYVINTPNSTHHPPQPIPTTVASPTIGHTALHTVLQKGINLESVQVSGSPALTDSCLESILSRNSLSKLKRFVVSQPISIDHRVVPLTCVSVQKILSTCTSIQCVGDLKHWAVNNYQRRKLSRCV